MSRRQLWIFAAFFAGLIAASNYTVQFRINEWLTYGAIIYPITFLFTDILGERYGKSEVLKVVIYGSLLAVVPTILISDWRIALASIITFFLVQQLDVHIFHSLKERFPRAWWLRNNASTMTSQFFDTLLFFTLAFAFVLPFDVLIKLIIGDYLVKLAIAALDTPFFYYFAINRFRPRTVV